MYCGGSCVVMDNLRIATLNVRGLGDNLKRKRVFRYMKLNKIDACMLQETHCTGKFESVFSNMWGSKCIFANGTSNARGVAILLNKKLSNNVLEVRRDCNGRYILCKLQIGEYTYCITNIYAPNEDTPSFFTDIFNQVRELDCIFQIVGGDFNVVLNPELDRSMNRIYNGNSRDILLKEIESNNWIDPWRDKNPEKKVFSWMRGLNRNEWSRIDYFLISGNIYNNCNNIEIMPSLVSDHCMVVLEIVVNNENARRGPGSWKFNNELLNDVNFCNEMELILKGTSRAYRHLNETDLWELVKFEAGQFSRQFAKSRSNNEKEYKFDLYNELSSLQEKLISDGASSDETLNRVESIQAELNGLEIVDAKRSAFRCRMQYTQYGEVSSKYYFNLEKRNYTSKTMYATRRSDGSLTKDYREILNIQHDFYERLYTKDENVHFSLQNVSKNVLSREIRLAYEELITPEELFDAQMTLKCGKTPGGDGLTLEFYCRFWKILVPILHANYIQCYRDGILNPSGRRGIINLIPKKGDLTFLKCWRPISILNYDYRIWAKAIANRLEVVADKLIGKQQNAFIKKRSIFSNLRCTSEILTHYNKTKKAGVIILVDFEKCFDRVNFESIKGTFINFGFGENFIKMLFLLFTKLEMCTTSNGYHSDYFVKTRGVNQGCPASPLIYCFTSELMAQLIYQNPNIKGLSVNGVENILSQFADDTSAYLEYSQLCINAFLDTLSCIESQIGLKVSYDKTTIYRIGSLVDSNAKLFTRKNLKWSNDNLHTLGIYMNCTGCPVERNYRDVINKIHKVCSAWVNRNATLYGKVLIINTLMGSLFVYKMSVMSNLSPEQIHEIENIFREFIWKGKKPKIALKTLMGLKEQGGLRLVNLKNKQDALKISWVHRLQEDNFLSHCAYSVLEPTLRELIWKCNLCTESVKKLYDCTDFWVEILLAWSRLNFRTPISSSEVREELLWYNSFINQKGRPLWWKHWYTKGILMVEDIFNEDGEPKDPDALGVNWLEFRTLLACIPCDWKNKLKHDDGGRNRPLLFTELSNCKNVSRNVYDRLSFDLNLVEKYRENWAQKENVSISKDDYINMFLHIPMYTKISKYRDFQYRLNLCKIITNKDLKDWNVSDCDLCSLCGKNAETIRHLFLECEYARCLLVFINDICNVNNIEINMNETNILFSYIHKKKSHIMNFVCTLYKQFVYKKRCARETFTVHAFKCELNYIQSIELAIARKESRVRNHIVKWSPIYKFENVF